VRNLLSALGVRVTWASVDHHAAAEQIKRGDLAATAVLSGKPVSSLSEYKREAGFHFLSVPYIDSLPSGYLPAKLSHADYTDLVEPSESVDTVAVGSGLFAYDWPARSARNRLLGEFVQAFFSKGAEWAHSIGHPKWQEINLAANLPGWRRQAVAERWLKREQSAQSDVAARQDFEQFLNATGSVTPERLIERSCSANICNGARRTLPPCHPRAASTCMRSALIFLCDALSTVNRTTSPESRIGSTRNDPGLMTRTISLLRAR